MIHGCPVTESLGQEVIHATVEQYLDVVKALDDEGYTMCVDSVGVDYLDFMGRSLPDRRRRRTLRSGRAICST